MWFKKKEEPVVEKKKEEVVNEVLQFRVDEVLQFRNLLEETFWQKVFLSLSKNKRNDFDTCVEWADWAVLEYRARCVGIEKSYEEAGEIVTGLRDSEVLRVENVDSIGE